MAFKACQRIKPGGKDRHTVSNTGAVDKYVLKASIFRVFLFLIFIQKSKDSYQI
jgi:hypothetical protein